MKEGLRKTYRKFSFEFADFLIDRWFRRTNSKRKLKHYFTKSSRQSQKEALRKELIDF